MPAKPKTLEEIVKQQFPQSTIMEVVDSAPQLGQMSGANVKRSPTLAARQQALQRKSSPLAAMADSLAAVPSVRKLKKSAEGPSGMVILEPRTADGGRAVGRGKAVIVSRGRIIAQQG